MARTLGVEIRSSSSEIHFDEINDSELLMLPEECEFQKYRLIVKKIEYAAQSLAFPGKRLEFLPARMILIAWQREELTQRAPRLKEKYPQRCCRRRVFLL